MNKLYPTKNDLNENLRKDMILILNENLANGVNLALQAKQAHWNVKGPHFAQLHQLFDKLYTEANGWADSMAERAVQLGGVAQGTIETVQKATRLPVYDTAIADGRRHVEAIAQAIATFTAGTRRAIARSGEAGDAVSSDLFTGISAEADKMLWFVEAHLQSER